MYGTRDFEDARGRENLTRETRAKGGTLWVFWILLNASNSIGQINLVANGSFENYSECPDNYGQITRSVYWTDPNAASTDYFHSCAESGSGVSIPPQSCDLPISALDGNGMAGLIIRFNSNFREYLQNELLTPLDTSAHYKFNAYLHSTCISNSNYTGSIGVYFTSDFTSIASNNLFSFTPAIQRNPDETILFEDGWILWTDTVTSIGGERYMIIGNFLPDSLTPMLGQDVGAYLFIDHISLTLLDTNTDITERNEVIEFGISPNPASDWLALKYKGKMKMRAVSVTDMSGRFLQQYGAVREIDVGGLRNGLYYITVEFDSGVKATQKLVVQRE